MKTKIENGNIITTIENGDEVGKEYVYTGPTMAISKSLPGGQSRQLDSYSKKKQTKSKSGTTKTSSTSKKSASGK